MLVYWSGAAMALEADVQLRAMADGMSLDVVLGQLADCCLPSERIWSASELFRKLDTFSPQPVFIPLYEAYMARRGMPALATLYQDLGIELVADGVSLGSEGRLAAVREAIMRPRTEEGDQGG
jgi:hypothetical protein